MSDSECNSDYSSCDPEVPPVVLQDALDSADKIRHYLIQRSAIDQLRLFSRFERSFNRFVVSDHTAKKQRLITDFFSS